MKSLQYLKLNQLTEQDLSFINREGERIKYTISKLVSAFPNHAKTITGMSKWLAANKSTCQRIVETINKATDGLQVIEFLPGPKGLDDFVSLSKKNKVDAILCKMVSDAILRFKNLIFEFSRSHSSLKQLIKDSKVTETGHPNNLQSRKDLFQAARAISRESIETAFTAFIFKENEDNPKFLQQFTLNYFEGAKFAEGARPMAILVAPCEQELQLDDINIASTSQLNQKPLPEFSVVKELTSPAVLENVDISIKDEWVVIPFNSLADKDISLGVIKNYAFEQISPIYGGKNASSISSYIRTPIKQLYMLCFMEKKFAMRSSVNVGIYSSISKMVKEISSPEDLWFDRYHDDVDLNLLETSVNFSEKLQYENADKLINTFFELCSEQKENYTCYLVKMEYPIWSMAYRFYFQYAF